MLIASAIEDKNWYSKDEALIRMIALGAIMKLYLGNQFYCYKDGVFYVSNSPEFSSNDSTTREWNPNYGSIIGEWVNVLNTNIYL